MDTQINIKGKYALASKIIRGEDFRNNLNYYDLLCLFDSYLKNCDLKDEMIIHLTHLIFSNKFQFLI